MPEDLKQREESSPSANQAEIIDEQLEIALIRAKQAFLKHSKKFGRRIVREAFDDLEEAADDGLISAGKINELSADEHKVELFIEKRKDNYSEDKADVFRDLRTGVEAARNNSAEAATHAHSAAENTSDSNVIKIALVIGAIFAFGSPYIAVLLKPSTDGFDNFLHPSGNGTDKAFAQYVLSNVSSSNFSTINNYVSYNNTTIINNNYCENFDRYYKNKMPIHPKKIFAANRIKQFHRQQL